MRRWSVPPETVKPRLELLQQQIAGVTLAYADPPNSLKEADAPTFINLEGAAEFNDEIYGPGTYQESRDYRMLLYVAHRGSGIPGEAAGRALQVGELDDDDGGLGPALLAVGGGLRRVRLLAAAHGLDRDRRGQQHG